MEDVGCRSARKRSRMSEETSSSMSTSTSLKLSNCVGKGMAGTVDNLMKLKPKNVIEEEEEEEGGGGCRKMETNRSNRSVRELGNGSEVVYYPTFISEEEGWGWLDYLNTKIPWNRPTLRVFGRNCVQPRESCYVASEGVAELKYSGHQPHPYCWHQFPPLITLLKAVEEAVPGSRFNSVLLNRYKCGSDYVGWHSDDEPLYGPTPLIASLSFGCDRPFFLKKKKKKKKTKSDEEEKGCDDQQHSFTLKHGSLLLMKGNTQRDWVHSVPKRLKLDALRINLTFRLVL